jgi:hypothetical protein
MQALDINTNYLVLPDDATRKMLKLFEMLFIVWITVHILVHIVGIKQYDTRYVQR